MGFRIRIHYIQFCHIISQTKNLGEMFLLCLHLVFYKFKCYKEYIDTVFIK